MKKIVFLSCDSLQDYITDDHILAHALEESGKYQVSTRSWRAQCDWTEFDLALIRTTWDYTTDLPKFLETLEHIEAAGVKVLNPLAVVKWNAHKSYLRELYDQGVTIVPTVFFKAGEAIEIPFTWNGKLIVKPAVGASARDTQVFRPEQWTNIQRELSEGDWLLQPFQEHIVEGEISLFFFNRNFSHAILKVPKPQDFRVQEEHGGHISLLQAEAALIELGANIIKLISGPLLYARVDLIPFEGGYALMELELIEPALYFRIEPMAAANFLKALDESK